MSGPWPPVVLTVEVCVQSLNVTAHLRLTPPLSPLVIVNVRLQSVYMYVCVRACVQFLLSSLSLGLLLTRWQTFMQTLSMCGQPLLALGVNILSLNQPLFAFSTTATVSHMCLQTYTHHVSRLVLVVSVSPSQVHSLHNGMHVGKQTNKQTKDERRCMRNGRDRTVVFFPTEIRIHSLALISSHTDTMESITYYLLIT